LSLAKETIPEEVLKEIAPYILPDDHPAKLKFDNFFSKSPMTTCEKTFKKAGFRHPHPPLSLRKLGLNDCAKPDNIPFCSDITIAFLDTQTHHQWPILYHRLTPYLSLEKSVY
jgi:hypothetical protein